MNANLEIINILKDWKFHSNVELSKISWRFWWHLHALKKMWFKFEKEWDARKNKKEYWKLLSSPTYRVVNGRILTLNWDIKRLVKRFEREEKKKSIFEKIKLFFK